MPGYLSLVPFVLPILLATAAAADPCAKTASEPARELAADVAAAVDPDDGTLTQSLATQGKLGVRGTDSGFIEAFAGYQQGYWARTWHPGAAGITVGYGLSPVMLPERIREFLETQGIELRDGRMASLELDGSQHLRTPRFPSKGPVGFEGSAGVKGRLRLERQWLEVPEIEGGGRPPEIVLVTEAHDTGVVDFGFPLSVTAHHHPSGSPFRGVYQAGVLLDPAFAQPIALGADEESARTGEENAAGPLQAPRLSVRLSEQLGTSPAGVKLVQAASVTGARESAILHVEAGAVTPRVGGNVFAEGEVPFSGATRPASPPRVGLGVTVQATKVLRLGGNASVATDGSVAAGGSVTLRKPREPEARAGESGAD